MTSNPLALRRESNQILRYGGIPVAGAILGGVSALALMVSGRGTIGSALLVLGASALLFVPLDGEALGTWSAIILRFFSRSRWTACRYEHEGPDTHLTLRGRRKQRWATARFLGRSDLTDSAGSYWRDFESMLRRLAAFDEPTRFALYDYHVDETPTASLWVDREVAWSAPWQTASAPRPWALDSGWFREEWSYVRDATHFVAVVRVTADSVAVSNLFDRLRSPTAEWEVSLHGEVVPRRSALRRVRRASHATRSDDQLSRTFGFLPSAQRGMEHRAVVEREHLVAQGDALVKIALLLTCRATSLSELRHRVRAAVAHARTAGVKVQRGWGSQIDWFVLIHGGGE